MNLSPEWSPYLAACGFEAVHWSQLGHAAAADEEIARYAREHEMVIVTQDRDFGKMVAKSRLRKPSIIQLRVGRTTPELVGEPLVGALRSSAKELAAGAIITIQPNKTRLRLLSFPAAE